MSRLPRPDPYTECVHPAGSIVVEVTDWSTLHERCEDCGALVLSAKVSAAEAALLRRRLAAAERRRC